MARATTRKKTTAKAARTVPVAVLEPAAAKPRRLRLPAYKPFRFKRIKYPERLPNVWQLTAAATQLFWSRKRVFIGIAIVYAVLTIVLVRGFGGNTDIATLKSQFNFGPGKAASLFTGISVLTTLLTDSGTSASDASGAYQLIVGLLVSLATIWAARQVLAGRRISLRDALYQGMFPLIPFILVLLVVVLEALPLLIGAWLFVTVVTAGIASTAVEQWLWGGLFFVLAVISFYMLCSSLFGLYIVTLPDMTPMKALKNARQLVRYRRGQVFRKLIYLPFALLLVASLVMLPTIIFAAALAPWLFFVMSSFVLIAIHLYMYTVYKALLA